MVFQVDGYTEEIKTLATQILIIGGGPAGSTAALYLSGLGLDITLAEKKAFPRETLCGEFLSKEVADVLKDLNLFKDFIALKPNKIISFKSINPDGIQLKSKFNFDAYAMKRSVFDSFLLDKAKEKNVHVIQPAEVLSIRRVNSYFISELRNGFGKFFKIKSDLVIGAYGKLNTLDNNLHRSFVNQKSHMIGAKIHLPIKILEEELSDEIRIYTGADFYCGINRVNENEVTVCFLHKRKDSKNSEREILINTIKSNKYFLKVFSDEAIKFIQSVKIYGSGNIYFGKKSLIDNGIIMIGDAAQVISPLAGDGIGMAMESAKVLFGIIDNNKTSPINKTEIFSKYEKDFSKIFNKRLRTAKIIQYSILNKLFCKIGFITVKRVPQLLPHFIRQTRSGL